MSTVIKSDESTLLYPESAVNTPFEERMSTVIKSDESTFLYPEFAVNTPFHSVLSEFDGWKPKPYLKSSNTQKQKRRDGEEPTRPVSPANEPPIKEEDCQDTARGVP